MIARVINFVEGITRGKLIDRKGSINTTLLPLFPYSETQRYPSPYCFSESLSNPYFPLYRRYKHCNSRGHIVTYRQIWYNWQQFVFSLWGRNLIAHSRNQICTNRTNAARRGEKSRNAVYFREIETIVDYFEFRFSNCLCEQNSKIDTRVDTFEINSESDVNQRAMYKPSEIQWTLN